jgi:hypothetical protein
MLVEQEVLTSNPSQVAEYPARLLMVFFRLSLVLSSYDSELSQERFPSKSLPDNKAWATSSLIRYMTSAAETLSQVTEYSILHRKIQVMILCDALFRTVWHIRQNLKIKIYKTIMGVKLGLWH